MRFWWNFPLEKISDSRVTSINRKIPHSVVLSKSTTFNRSQDTIQHTRLVLFSPGLRLGRGKSRLGFLSCTKGNNARAIWPWKELKAFSCLVPSLGFTRDLYKCLRVSSQSLTLLGMPFPFEKLFGIVVYGDNLKRWRRNVYEVKHIEVRGYQTVFFLQSRDESHLQQKKLTHSAVYD